MRVSSPPRLFLDTAYIQALLSEHDPHHVAAVSAYTIVRTAPKIWVTEAVLIELAAALSRINRQRATQFIHACYTTPNIEVVTVDTALLMRGLQLYDQRPDKEWSLTDCISFVVMRDIGIIHAATTDHHFIQAGFQTLM